MNAKTPMKTSDIVKAMYAAGMSTRDAQAVVCALFYTRDMIQQNKDDYTTKFGTLSAERLMNMQA